MNIETIASITGGEVTSAKKAPSVAEKLEAFVTNRFPAPAGYSWNISHQAGGFMLELVNDATTGSKSVSPCMGAKALQEWLVAFSMGYFYHKDGRV